MLWKRAFRPALQICLQRDAPVFAIKNLLAGSVGSREITRDASDENDEIELLDLAESLLEKLTQIKFND